MRRVLIALTLSTVGLLAPAGVASAAPQVPPLPCAYWVHGCDPVPYVCDAAQDAC